MPKLKIYQVDAFASQVFSGNPAAVCMVDSWLDDKQMQDIAAENNLAETAFVKKEGNDYAIRWFTPTIEVDLCGHATLAAAYILFNFKVPSQPNISFISEKSGILKVTRQKDMLFLDFPTDTLRKVEEDRISACIGMEPKEIYKGRSDFLVFLEKEDQVKSIIPNFSAIAELSARGLIITAAGKKVDFVSRFFAPQSGINEDPVTGSAHTSLIPFWNERTGKEVFTATQLSARGGELQCYYKKDRCLIGGKAVLYLEGEIFI